MSNVAHHPCALLTRESVSVLQKNSVLASNTLGAITPLQYTPRALQCVNIGPYGVGVGHDEFTKDAEQVVQQTYMYVATRKEQYAKNGIAILNAWTTTCTTFKGSNAPLEMGWGACSFARAAEILKYTYKTPECDRMCKSLDRFFTSIALPILRTKLGWTNNWQITICEARLQIAIFRDDRSEVEWAMNEYKRIVDVYVMNTGQTQETLRDLVHAQFGIGGLLQIPDLIYSYSNKTIDLFRVYTDKIHKMCELHAQLLLGEIPSVLSVPKSAIKEPWFLPCGWEIALFHLQYRLQKDMPKTKALVKKHGPEKYVFHWGLGSLSHTPMCKNIFYM